MKKYLFIIILTSLSIFSVFSQVGSIISPFVSRIKATATESSIKITWQDTKDISGRCVIYRHTAEINTNNFSKAVKVGEVLQGVEFFEDYPQKAYTNYYYCVIIKDGDNFLHEVFVPFRNKLTKAVSIIEVQKRDSSYLDPASINSIKASVFVDSIIVSFSCNKPTSEILIYRNTQPIITKNDLLSSSNVAKVSGGKGIFSDYPIPGVDYFYAAIDSILAKSENFTLEEGKNTTSASVCIPIDLAGRIGLPKTNSSRSNPLPLLSVSRDFQNGKELPASLIDTMPQYRAVSKKTESIVKEITDNLNIETKERLRPLILKENRNPSDNSEKKILNNILKEDFETYNYSKARERLSEFLKIERPKDIEASVHFYLGQIYYFLKQYNKAFIEFILAEDYFYMETIPWKKDVYYRLRQEL